VCPSNSGGFTSDEAVMLADLVLYGSFIAESMTGLAGRC
jgi:hypothetical protein